jgi:hypothetical protein
VMFALVTLELTLARSLYLRTPENNEFVPYYDRAMYQPPFHGSEFTYDLTLKKPIPQRHLHESLECITLHWDATFSR